MKETYKTIDYKWLTKPTGDPFADAGGFAIEYLLEKSPEKDILELIEYITKIYVEKWDGKINAFFLNSKITQPAFDNKRKIEETLKYFESLINESEPYEIGYCRITGQKTKLFFGGRDNSIMTGSGTFINFHHFFQKGISLSKEALIRMYFIPFVCQQLEGKICLIQSSNEKLSKLFVKRTIDQNLKDIATGTSTRIAKSNFNKPANAIFDFVDYSLNYLNELKKEEDIMPSLTLYHFTNFGASPEIKIYQLPSQVFLFYRTCMQPKFKTDWQNFVRSHYFDNKKYRSAKYNPQAGTFELIKSKETETIDFEEYKQWSNRIYNKLISNKSIIPEILRWSRKHPFKFEIVSIYQQNIMGMKKETINKIKELAVFLVREENADKIKKRIRALDSIKNAAGLRRFILRDVIAENYNSGNKEAILTLEDYINYLFPDGSHWSEIRDLLLIAIYQEMHERNLISEELKVDFESEEIEEIEAEN
jgi:CRISPR-associated protein Cst1